MNTYVRETYKSFWNLCSYQRWHINSEVDRITIEVCDSFDYNHYDQELIFWDVAKFYLEKDDGLECGNSE